MYIPDKIGYYVHAKVLISFAIVFTTLFHSGIAQKKSHSGFQLFVHYDNGETVQESFSDTTAGTIFLKEHLARLKYDGHLTASLDSTVAKPGQLHAYVYRGNSFSSIVIKPDSYITPTLDDRSKKLIGKPVSLKVYRNVFDGILRKFTSNGYPFASIKFDSIEIDSAIIKVQITVDESLYIPFGELSIVPKDIVSNKFLSDYLQIRSGDEFNKDKIKDIRARIERLEFLKLTSAPSLSFVNDTAYIGLELKKRKTNVFDGFVGVFPNQANGNSSKTLVTGKADLRLQNLFKSGKSFNLEWNRQKELSQTLNASYRHPVLFRSSLNGELGFNLLKEDTTFVTRQLSLKLDGMLTNNWSFALGFSRKNGDLLSGEDRNVSVQNNLLNTDYSLLNYSLGLFYRQLDDPIYTRRGFRAVASATIGQRKFGENSNIASDQFDLTGQEDTRLQLDFSYQWYQPLTSFLNVFHRLSTAHILAENSFLNDMFRLGGLQNLRGFNDNFYFASNYGLSNLELQLYFEDRSYLFLLYDQAWIYYYIDEVSNINDKPGAIGTGISLDTGSGALKFVYALGRSKTQPFDFQQSKIHIGFQASF